MATENDIAAALAADHAAGGDPDAPTRVRVLFDVFAWTTPAPAGSKGRVVHHHASRGEVVTVTRAQAIRGRTLGAVQLLDDPAADEGAEEQEAAQAAAGDLAFLDDPAELAKVAAADVLAYIAQHGAESDEAEQVAALEAERGAKARKSILKAAGWTGEDIARALGATE